MSKSWIRCSREIRSLTNELNQVKRELEILRWFVAGVIILLSLLFIWMIRMRRSQSNGRTDSTSGASVETISAQSSPTESPVISPRCEAANSCVRVSNVGPSPSAQTVKYRRLPQCLKRTCCRASTEAISCCLVPTLSPCTSPVWIAVTTQSGLIEQDPHSNNFRNCSKWFRRGGKIAKTAKVKCLYVLMVGATSCLDQAAHAFLVADAIPISCPCVEIFHVDPRDNVDESES